MREKVLITGASGFVGYHLINEALKNNLEVYAAVRKSSSIDHLNGIEVKYVYPDFKDQASLAQLLKDNGINYIIHAAGATKARSQNEYDTINAAHTVNLAKAAVNAGPQFKKLVLISSLAAVGPINSLNGIITNDTVPNPVTAYGRSKLAAEQQLKTVEGLNYTILRPTAVYGPRDKDIFIFFKQVVKGIEPYIGNKAQKLTFIYVTDLAEVSVKALFAGSGKTYIISDGNFYSRYELGNITKSVLNLKAIKFHLPVNLVKVIAAIAEKVSSLSNKASALNIEKLKELTAANWNCEIEQAKHDLGFYPKYDLDAGLTETLKWYKANNWL
ncbi:NAD(P)-dependent oxidoreductase [Mucilaginibacter sp. UR6-1]|uniref:NAD-dependent epimerase/dehydratase family protein n=1 Tax=Mucilaginibacter sp. UR6-1 TaxID=1435643 RepID=UPI001E57CCD0|nr:NAD(P)-dependent oxidoreductase [Mucilaginibacter sp. UR6-1]MCC8407872.1 NAD(P)-dependent oxidoreductase [Mucilaginibacter sp. UR6-1]